MDSITDKRRRFFSNLFSLGFIVLLLIGDWPFQTARSAPGDLDPSFGEAGVLETGRFCCGSGEAMVGVVQPDGKLVVAGQADFGQLTLVRYLADGRLDPSFGEEGQASTGGFLGMAIALQPDGKLVVAGGQGIKNPNGEAMALARFLPDGRLDESFGIGGKVLTKVRDSFAQANALVIQPDGKVVVAGWNWENGQAETLLVRYQPDGAIDRGFGSEGVLFSTVKATRPEQTGLALQQDGKLVVAATLSSINSQGNAVSFAVLMRYQPDGSPDADFGSGGILISSLGEPHRSSLSALVIQADGKLVAAGFAFDGQNRAFALARYDADGNLDRSFGVDGQVILSRPNESSVALTLLALSDGQLAAIGDFIDLQAAVARRTLLRFDPNGTLDTSFGDQGRIATSANSLVRQLDDKLIGVGDRVAVDNNGFALSRFNLDGSLDSGFGNGGRVKTDVGMARSSATSILLQTDGKLVSGGWVYEGDRWSMALVRLLSDGTLDPSFGLDGQVLTAAEDLNTGVSDLLIQADGKLVAIGAHLSGDGLPQGLTTLVRYTPEGSLDTGFGVAGKVMLPDFQGRVLGLQLEGKLVAAGLGWDGTSNLLTLVRFNPDGGLDQGFGDHGRVLTSMSLEWAGDLLVQADGKLVVVGQTRIEGNPLSALRRFRPDGRPDQGFGDQGLVLIKEIYAPSSVVVQKDGKLVVAGSGWQPLVGVDRVSVFALARYHPDGRLDTGFGDGGILLSGVQYQDSFGDSLHAYASGLVIEADGKLIAGGNLVRSDYFGYTWAIGSLLIRYNPDGRLDTGFGDAGQLVTSFDDTGASIHAMALQANGKLVTAGGIRNLFALARYCTGTCDEEPLDRIHVSGRVRVAGSDIPVCALVLANGKSQFSCDGDGGFHLTEVPLDSNQEVTLFAWAEGFEPFKTLIHPRSPAQHIDVELRLPSCGQGPQPDQPPQPSALSQVSLSGKVRLLGTDIPVCALVMANGKHSFSCDGAGNYHLDQVPIDQAGQLTLYSWADGFTPLKILLAPTQATETGDIEMRVQCH